MVWMMVDLLGLFNTDGFIKSSDESMRMKEPIGPAHPRWVGGGHDGKKDLTTAGHERWCRAVQPPSAFDLLPPASCGVCRDGGRSHSWELLRGGASIADSSLVLAEHHGGATHLTLGKLAVYRRISRVKTGKPLTAA